MESLEATTNVLHKRAAPYLLVALLSTLPATSALAETVTGDLIVNNGVACVGGDCTTDTFPFDPLRIHGPEPVLSMVDSSSDGLTDRDWSIGITDESTGGASEFFIRDEVSGAQVLRMNVDGAVALGARAELVKNAVSVGSDGNERKVTWVADGEADTDAVNMRQFEAFQARALESVGGNADELDQQLQEMNDRIDDLAARIDRLASKVE